MDATLRLGGSFRVTNKPLHLPSIVPETPMEENAMAKDRSLLRIRARLPIKAWRKHATRWTPILIF